MTAAKWWLLLAVSVVSVVACGDGGKKKKKAKVPKPASAEVRAERLCQATCFRELKCHEGDDEPDREKCLKRCRLARTPIMHNFRPRFVATYADCVAELSCDEGLMRCQAIAVATEMEDPEKAEKEAAKDAEEEPAEDGEETGDEKKKDKKAEKAKEKDKPKKTPTELALLRRDKAAAIAGRELFERCHDRRLSCDVADGEDGATGWQGRCDMLAALTDGGRRRSAACLSQPCDRVRRCLQEAVSW